MGIALSNAWKSASTIINSAISLLPNIILAGVIFILFLRSWRQPNPSCGALASGSSVIKTWDCYSATSHM